MSSREFDGVTAFVTFLSGLVVGILAQLVSQWLADRKTRRREQDRFKAQSLIIEPAIDLTKWMARVQACVRHPKLKEKWHESILEEFFVLSNRVRLCVSVSEFPSEVLVAMEEIMRLYHGLDAEKDELVDRREQLRQAIDKNMEKVHQMIWRSV